MCFFVFLASKSMILAEKWMSCVRCAALEIVAAKLRNIQNTCSCHFPLNKLGHLFYPEDDPEDFSVLDCEEGIESSSKSSIVASSLRYWNAESQCFQVTSPSTRRSTLALVVEKIPNFIGCFFFRRWCCCLPLMRRHCCPHME